MNAPKPYLGLSTEQKIEFSKKYMQELKTTLDLLSQEEIGGVLETLEKAFLNGKKIFIAWNWWSAATASHMASDLQKTTLWKQPQTKTDIFKFKAIALSDNIPVMTARGNDEGFDYIFSEQLKILWDTWDVLVIITGSGNSKNIIQVIESAKMMWITTIGFLWFDGGKAKPMLDQSILVPSNKYWPIEDIHMILDHLITWYFQQQINKAFE